MDFIDYFILFTVGVTLLLVPSILFRGTGKKNIIISLLVFFAGYFQLYIFAVYRQEIVHYPHFFFSQVPASICIGFMVFYFVRTVVLEEEFLFKKNWVTTIPFFIIIITLPLYIYHMTVKDGEVIVYFTGGSQVYNIHDNWKNGLIGSYLSKGTNTILNIVQILSISYAIFFFTLSLHRVRKRLDYRESSSSRYLITVIILGFCIVTGISALLSVAAFNTYLLKLTGVLLGIIILFVYFLLQVFPGLFEESALDNRKPGVQKKPVEGVDIESFEKKLQGILSREKLYCDEDLTLSRLSTTLKVKPHFLSRFINERYEMNFNNFINRYRVNEAEQILLEEPERNTISIAMSVGFNSYSTFHAAFKKYTGYSPADFRKKKLGKGRSGG